jgi:site-specific DNA-methyltransferase (adenine-specific)
MNEVMNTAMNMADTSAHKVNMEMDTMPRNTILIGDALARLAELPDVSVDCVVTSPPYYQLRDYGVGGQLGLEPTVDGWVQGLRAVAGQVARVLKPSGAFWLNLGDSFSRHEQYGAPAKSLLLAPERLVLALASDGWLVRNKVIWAKTNPMPSSIRDRLSLTWEVLYLLVRSPHYYFDLDAIREPHTSTSGRSARASLGKPDWAGPLAGTHDGLRRARAAGVPGHPLGKNPGDVWRVPTRGYAGAHFATFPAELIRRPILATCPALVCGRCGRACGQPIIGGGRGPTGPRCDLAVAPRPGIVLDPFFGTGTVGLVARELGRDWLGIEIKPEYVALARQRLGLSADPPLEAAA